MRRRSRCRVRSHPGRIASARSASLATLTLYLPVLAHGECAISATGRSIAPHKEICAVSLRSVVPAIAATVLVLVCGVLYVDGDREQYTAVLTALGAAPFQFAFLDTHGV